MKLLVKNTIYPAIKAKPDFLIVGVQRAATMSLYRYLTQHPQIITTHPLRETYYFDHLENYNKGIGWYLGHFPSKFSKGEKLTFEASPSYFFYKEAPQRIKQSLGSLRMIVLLRDPAKRAYSAWQMFHSYSQQSNPVLKARADKRTFSKAIEQELNPHLSPSHYSYNYINRGKYIEQLENYYRYFNKDSILILNFEDFCNNTRSCLDRVCKFLNIDCFSSAFIQEIQDKKYAKANYIIHPDDETVIESLKQYFMPFNKRLYTLLGNHYDW